MSDYSELKRVAEAATPGPWAYDGSYVCPARTEDGTTYVELWRSIADCHQPENTKFIAAANPAAVLALLAEVEEARNGMKHSCAIRLKKEIERLETERDHLKEENQNLRTCRSSVNAAVAIEVEALRKDAERYRWLRDDSIDPGTVIDKKVGVFNSEDGGYPIWEYRAGDELDSAIDAAMTKGAKP